MKSSVAALAVVFLTGCAGATPQAPSSAAVSAASSASPHTSAAASQSRTPDAGESNELTGVLDADPIEGGCAYLRADDGTRYEVVYPPGWSIDRSSATLRDPTGMVVASGGDVITIRGREATDMVSFCQIGPIFQATEVVSVE